MTIGVNYWRIPIGLIKEAIGALPTDPSEWPNYNSLITETECLITDGQLWSYRRLIDLSSLLTEYAFAKQPHPGLLQTPTVASDIISDEMPEGRGISSTVCLAVALRGLALTLTEHDELKVELPNVR